MNQQEVGIFDRIVAFVAMIRDAFAKRYKPRARFYIAIIVGLVYFLMPLDALPDLVPLVGFVDDISVLGLCGKVIWDEVNYYLEHVNIQQQEANDADVMSVDALPSSGGNPEG